MDTATAQSLSQTNFTPYVEDLWVTFAVVRDIKKLLQKLNGNHSENKEHRRQAKDV
jgi:hypothetical protein